MKCMPVFSLTLLLISLTAMDFIAIRDDRDDSAYLALGKKYPAVGKVGEGGGDGTLVAPRWVLTAAHVAEGLYQREGKNLKVFFENSPVGVSVEAVFIHPDYQPMGDHDIALIKLTQPVEGISPADLYTEADEKGQEIVIVGHGDFKTGKETAWKTDGQKRGATNRIDAVTEAQIIYSFDAPGSKGVTDLEGTAGRGDSGGPAFITANEKLWVAGVSSAGFPGVQGPGTYGAVEHYTRVSVHLGWLQDVLEGRVKPLTSTKANVAGPAVLDGLGIFLTQRGDRIEIDGKIDPKVPKEFRHIMFRPAPCFLVSLNGKNYESLELFKKDFQAIKPGTKYDIEFSIRGKVQAFGVVR